MACMNKAKWEKKLVAPTLNLSPLYLLSIYSVAKRAEVTYLVMSSLALLHGRGMPEHANNNVSPAQGHGSNH